MKDNQSNAVTYVSARSGLKRGDTSILNQIDQHKLSSFGQANAQVTARDHEVKKLAKEYLSESKNVTLKI